jgi:hypothetical protein
VAAVILGACGSGDEGKHRPAARAPRGGESPQREAAERGRALANIPADDRVAFFQIATTSGLLRSEALRARRGQSGSAATALNAARARLRATRPREHELAALRKRLLAELSRARTALDSGGAQTSLAVSDAVSRGLQRYVRGHPAIGALVPD